MRRVILRSVPALAGLMLHAGGPVLAVTDPIVAKVDGTPVYRSEMERELGPAMAQLSRFPPEQAAAMREQLEKRVLNDLIGKILLRNAATGAGIEVSDAELEARLKAVVTTVSPNGSIDGFLEETGISRERLKSDVRGNLLIQKLVDQETAGIDDPSEDEIAAFHEANAARFVQQEQVECRHILADAQGLTDPVQIEAKRQQAEAIRKMLLENPGLDFARVAREKSDGPNRENGGYLGFMKRDEFVPEFTEMAFSQEPGKIGEVVRTQFGFHVIRVESHLEHRPQTLDEVHDQIRDGLRKERKGRHMRKRIDAWRKAARIELMQAAPFAEKEPEATP